MAVINYDVYNACDTFTQVNDWWTPADGNTTINWNVYWMCCPHCQGYIWQSQWFHYCPYCGKQLYPQPDKKAQILKRLDDILKEVEDIKKELTKE